MSATPQTDELERTSDFSKHLDLAALLALCRRFEAQQVHPVRSPFAPGEVLVDLDREIDAEANPKHHPDASYYGIIVHLEHILRGYRESIALGEEADNPHSPGSARHTSWALGAHWAKNDLRRAGIIPMPVVTVQTQPKTETP